METYLVSANHVSPDYQFTRTEVKVHKCPDGRGFYADHNKLGCGKTHKTSYNAIHSLFSDHAFTNVDIESAQS